MHISLLPNGKILYWGRDKVFNSVTGNYEDVGGHTRTYLVDPLDFVNDPLGHTQEFIDDAAPQANLFCSGHSFLPDGRLLVTGGHDKSTVDPFKEGLGEKSVYLFDYRNANRPWTKHPTGLAKGRWYPYNVALPNGDVAIFGGTYWTNRPANPPPNPQPAPQATPNEMPEKYSFAPGGPGTISTYVQEPSRPPVGTAYYPFLHLIQNGKVMVADDFSTQLVEFDAQNVARFRTYPNNNQIPEPHHGWAGDARYNGSSALYDISTGKIVAFGGTPAPGELPSTATAITDLSDPDYWEFVTPMAYKRKFHTATFLPDGKIMVSGGTQCRDTNNVSCAEGAVFNPEIWNPDNLTWSAPMARNPSGIPRVYHSVGLLLPDARVLVGGGGLPAALGEDPDPGTNAGRIFGHQDAEIFSPPYLFTLTGQPAVRPVINPLASSTIVYGQSNFQVNVTSTQPISSVVLIRLGSVTHGNNQDQRLVPLSFTTNGSTLTVTGPANGSVCPPGPYMLFVLTNDSTATRKIPSVAQIVTVTATPPAVQTNVALAANGATADASSEANSNFRAATAIDGDKTGNNWSNGGGWNDATQGEYAKDWVKVEFNATRIINEINVYTLRDNFSQTTDPDLGEEFNHYGIKDFDVQYLSGSGWVTVDCGNPSSPCGRVYDNRKVRTRFQFSPVQTSAIRVAVHGAAPLSGNNYSRIVEIEASLNFSTNLAFNKTATQSSTYQSATAAKAVDGNPDGAYANGSVSHTGDNNRPWWQVDLGSAQDLDSVRIFNRTDSCCLTRLRNFVVLVGDNPIQSPNPETASAEPGVTAYPFSDVAGPQATITTRRRGRYVRIQLYNNDFLALAEVQVMSAVNLASNRTATQSSTYQAATAAKAVDGNRDGNFSAGSVTHTNDTNQPWWQIDLGANSNLDFVRLWNRTDPCGGSSCGVRLSDFYVFVSDRPFTHPNLAAILSDSSVFNVHFSGTVGPYADILLSRTGRYVRIQLRNNNYLSLAEVEIFAAVAPVNVALAANGSVARASSTLDSRFSESTVIDGDRTGRNWPNGGGWNDATENEYAGDWLRVRFAGTKTIDKINVHTLRNDITGTPPLGEIFSLWGITYFDVQYLNGGTWVNIPGGRVMNNNLVLRQFSFAPISTSAIRVAIRDAAFSTAPNNYSRIVEVEALQVP